MKLKDMGEFGFIDHISSDCIYDDELIIQGIGDDCSVCISRKGKVRLVTTDLLVEGVHFLREAMTGFELGHKSLAVNLSDIASMGGKAKEIYLSLAIPKDIEVAFLEQFYEGMKSLSAKYKVNILGGDTTSSLRDLTINVTVIGEMPEEEVLYRRGAQIGDIVYLTGYIGDSGAGLDIILNQREIKSKRAAYLRKAHLMPYPYLDEGQWLASQKKLTSMIDLSDGFASDLGHICYRSKVGAIVREKQLPLSKELKDHAKEYELDLLKLSLNTGEDYVLLFTVPFECSLELEKLYEKKFGRKIYPVGEIVEKEGIELFRENQETIQISKGFNHFA